MRLTKKLNALFLCAFLFSNLFLVSCTQKEPQFVKHVGKNFVIGEKPYYFIGANYWHGAILASKGEGGNRERLLKELDIMQEAGINNLRILAGAEGPNGEPTRVTPALQLSPGEYNEELLDGLDFLLSEMKKRNQYAILFINNAWDWSGGYAQYMNWITGRPIPYPSVAPHTWQEFMAFSGEFNSCADCQKLYQNFVKFILTRTNKYTGEIYVNDPTIMTWEIANEPRAFSTENIPAFEKFIKESAAFIKSIDPNHLVTTGTEGQHGCEESLALFERIHADPNIDYLTMHIWPKNWSWLNKGDIPAAMDTVILNTNAYMNDHIAIARKLNKPLVLEEFGLPRDKQGLSPDESVICRDKFYENAFIQIVQHSKNNDVLAGCNFWSFSGIGRATPGHVRWVRGDEILGDPPQEEQGLNSVFDTDSTMNLVRKYNKYLLPAN
jgi:mannan endo-1,4-beta-mannosidase